MTLDEFRKFPIDIQEQILNFWEGSERQTTCTMSEDDAKILDVFRPQRFDDITYG